MITRPILVSYFSRCPHILVTSQLSLGLAHLLIYYLHSLHLENHSENQA